MTEAASEFHSPYTPYPGSSTPSANVPRAEGQKDIWSFFWLSIGNSTIIAVAGIAAWFVVH